VATMFDDATRAVTLVAAAMGSAVFNRERMAERARLGWITATELADTLTRDHGVPFKTSHAVASRFVVEAGRRPGEPSSTLLREITSALVGRPIVYDEARLAEVLSPEYFVRVRTTPGGPAPVETARAIAASHDRLATDQEWIGTVVGKLRKAEEELRTAAAGL